MSKMSPSQANSVDREEYGDADSVISVTTSSSRFHRLGFLGLAVDREDEDVNETRHSGTLDASPLKVNSHSADSSEH